jgi:hypothetical protein
MTTHHGPYRCEKPMSLLRTYSRCFRQKIALPYVNTPGAGGPKIAHTSGARIEPCGLGMLGCRLSGFLGGGLRSVSSATASRLLAWDCWAARARPAVRRSSSLRGDACVNRHARCVCGRREVRDQGTESVVRISFLAHPEPPGTS